MEIERIDPTQSKAIKRFLTYPLSLHRDSTYWICPILSDQRKFLHPDSPFFEHSDGELYLALVGGKIVGRIGAVVNHRYNEFQGEKTGWFGFFDCVNDQTVADGLLRTAENYLRSHGMDRMRGPASFSTNEECALLVDGFDSFPVLMMPYNPPYYIDLLEGFGCQKAMDLLAYNLTQSTVSDRIERGAKLLEKRLSITIRPFDKKHYWDEVKRILEVYNQAWAKNWGFVPWTEREFFHLAKSMKSMADLDLAFVAEDGGQPVGFSLALPDAYQALKHIKGRITPWALVKLLYFSRKIDRIRILMMGVIKEYRNRGIDTLFYYNTVKSAIANGYKTGEISWILESNVEMNRAAEKMGAELYKRYRFYEYPLSGGN